MMTAGLHMHHSAQAGGETRTLRLYAVNTKESLTTTYMVDGRHVLSELAKINYLLRDWRRNAVIRIDPKTIDLMWELHSDLGSRAPIHIISGYRSAETNAMLKSIGRNVAKQSMHIQGRAIDLYFPDVPTERLRNSALVREIGGVGYYPRSGVSGFVHIDSGRVRHWPRIGEQQLARIYRDYRKTVGARFTREPATMVASVDDGGRQQKPAVVVADSYPVPTPRPRPLEVLMAAAAQLTIEPASAPVPIANFASKPSLVQDSLGPVPAAATLIEPQQSNTVAKGSFIAALRDGLADGVPLIRPIDASAGGGLEEDLLLWPLQWLRSVESLIRRDGAPSSFAADAGPIPITAPDEPFPPISEEDATELKVMIAALADKARYETETVQGPLVTASTKGDRLIVNRSSKGDLVTTAPPPRYGFDRSADAGRKLVRTFEALLASEDEPEQGD